MTRVLIADDDTEVRDVVRRCLERDGHDVSVTYDGNEALRLLTSDRSDVAVILLRRRPSPVGVPPPDITVGELTVSTAARSVTVKYSPVRLTRREFDLLLFFVTHMDTVFSREELLKHVWHWDFGDLSTITVHVKRLRSKLGDHHRVQTVWGRGYLWSGRD
jgi:DNA-binding response OmpR family regulator